MSGLAKGAKQPFQPYLPFKDMSYTAVSCRETDGTLWRLGSSGTPVLFAQMYVCNVSGQDLRQRWLGQAIISVGADS